MNKINKGVYLIKCKYEGADMLKIGFSSNIKKRLNTHLSSNPLAEVIGWIEEDEYKWLEKEIHYKCRNYRYKNTEWFRFDEKITDFFTTHINFKQW